MLFNFEILYARRIYINVLCVRKLVKLAAKINERYGYSKLWLVGTFFSMCLLELV